MLQMGWFEGEKGVCTMWLVRWDRYVVKVEYVSGEVKEFEAVSPEQCRAVFRRTIREVAGYSAVS